MIRELKEAASKRLGPAENAPHLSIKSVEPGALKGHTLKAIESAVEAHVRGGKLGHFSFNDRWFGGGEKDAVSQAAGHELSALQRSAGHYGAERLSRLQRISFDGTAIAARFIGRVTNGAGELITRDVLFNADGSKVPEWAGSRFTTPPDERRGVQIIGDIPRKSALGKLAKAFEDQGPTAYTTVSAAERRVDAGLELDAKENKQLAASERDIRTDLEAALRQPKVPRAVFFAERLAVQQRLLGKTLDVPTVHQAYAHDIAAINKLALDVAAHDIPSRDREQLMDDWKGVVDARGSVGSLDGMVAEAQRLTGQRLPVETLQLAAQTHDFMPRLNALDRFCSEEIRRFQPSRDPIAFVEPALQPEALAVNRPQELLLKVANGQLSNVKPEIVQLARQVIFGGRLGPAFETAAGAARSGNPFRAPDGLDALKEIDKVSAEAERDGVDMKASRWGPQFDALPTHREILAKLSAELAKLTPPH